MKQIQNAFKCLTVIALVAFAVGCTSDLHTKENLAVAAGFKVVTATTPDQISRLAALPPDRVTPINYKGSAGREEQPGLCGPCRGVSSLSAAPFGPAPE